MKSTILFFRLACAALLAGLFLPAHAAEQLYTCGMHPQIIRNAPGNCPICGMALTPIRANTSGAVKAGATGAALTGERKIKFWKSTMNVGEVSDHPGKDSMGMEMEPVYEQGTGEDSRTIHIDPVTIQRMNLRTGLVTHGPVLREFRTVGSVAYDETGLRDITTKYEGWIEKLLVDTTWAVVKTGDPLFEIYSPELYNAELNYLVALRSEGADGGPLTRAALARLQLFDVPADVIAELQRTGTAPRTFLYRAPAAGLVMEKLAVAGQMVKPGERIFRLADLAQVWVLAQIYEQDLPFVRAGQDATIRVTYGPEHLLHGQVDLLLPRVEDQTRTATARIVLPNPDGALRPGMFVDVRFAAKIAEDAVLVPDLAVLRSGEHDTVFIVNPDGSFEPREVRLGNRSQGNLYQVLRGLTGGERVVTSGQFMLDSESQLRDVIQKMLDSQAAAAAPAPTGSPVVPAQTKDEMSASSPRPTDSAAIGMEELSMLPPPARALLKDLAVATIDVGQDLATDDFAGYQRHLPPMRQALTALLTGYDRAKAGPLGKFQDAIPDRSDLNAARRDFAFFSTAVADLVRTNHLDDAEGFHVFQCPMAPGIGTGRWLQRTAELKNPFYGSAMLECGEELK
jgi:Cu(I)/Ag(I) efflux system membrane fusion protein